MNWFSPLSIFVSFLSFSQPLVHQEPHHVPIIQNRFVRILNVGAKTGDTTLFHIHNNDIGFLTIKGSKIWLQELGKEGRAVELPTGWIGSDLTHSENPIIHRFANVGDNDFQLIAFELLSKKFRNRVFSQIGITLYENERFNIQQIDNGIIMSEVPLVVIELSSAGKIQTLDLLKSGKKMQLVSKGQSTKTLIIQLK